MSLVSTQVGNRIRGFRRQRGMTLEALAAAIGKSRSTLSKYEKGEIAVDIETLYDLAAALRIDAAQLLCPRVAPAPAGAGTGRAVPAFFAGVAQFFGYHFDGRDGSVIRCVFDLLPAQTQDGRTLQGIAMYMNYADLDYYQRCETTYRGTIEHFDALTDIRLINQDTPMEQASCKILAPYADAPTKWGLWTGVSSRPVMPVATKMLLSRTPLPVDEPLIRRLKISREDIRLLKLYNMLAIV